MIFKVNIRPYAVTRITLHALKDGSDEFFACLLGIDGQVDMRRIYGTTVARRKGKQGREDKVCNQDIVMNNFILFGIICIVVHFFSSANFGPLI